MLQSVNVGIEEINIKEQIVFKLTAYNPYPMHDSVTALPFRKDPET